MIIAVVGAGGKTTYIKERARKYREEGKTVLVITSTHMEREAVSLLTDDPQKIREELKRSGFCMAGTAVVSATEKMGPLSHECFYAVKDRADVILVEADGAKHQWLKWPRDYEPVIYEQVDEIVVIMNLKAIGKPLEAVAHHPEWVAKALGYDNISHVVEARDIQTLIQKGYVKPLQEAYSNAVITVQPVGADTLYTRAIQTLLQEDMDVTSIAPEWFEVQPQLVILGAGHVAVEVAKLARFLDFYTIVIDDRPEFANETRFPGADEVLCQDFCQLESVTCRTKGAYYVVVTRGHVNDQVCVEQILNTEYSYLGMIGSRKKVYHSMEILEEKGYTQEQREGIHAPIGLPIKAKTPAEIAVSIMAEIIEIKNQISESQIGKEFSEIREAGILAIITEKTGSTPGQVGSQMFIGREEVKGTIGGGSMEYAAIQDGKKMLAENPDDLDSSDNLNVQFRTYDLSNGESAKLGMVCGGENQVIFIRI